MRKGAGLRGVAVVVILLAAFAAQPSFAQETTPEATVRDAYAITVRSLANTGKAAQAPWNPPHRERLITKRLAALFARDDVYSSESGDIGHLDSDPFISGQDGEVKGLRVSVTGRSGDRASVAADFKSFGGAVRVRFAMLLEDGRWRIDDIVNRVDGKDYPVRAALSQPYECGSFMNKPCKR